MKPNISATKRMALLLLCLGVVFYFPFHIYDSKVSRDTTAMFNHLKKETQKRLMECKQERDKGEIINCIDEVISYLEPQA